MPTLSSSQLAVPADGHLQLVLDVLPAIVAVLLSSLACGRLALLVGQPRVLGEMVAGVLLGPTLLGAVAPRVQEALFTPDVKSVLYVLSTIGLTLYMFLVGAGLDRGNEVGQGLRAVVLAVAGIVPAVLLGALVAFVYYDELSLPEVSRVQFCLFMGGALSITAFPMLARILYEHGLENSQLGRLTLMAASIDDAAAWCLLAVITAMHGQRGAGGAVGTIGLAAVFTVAMLLIVARLLRPLGPAVARAGKLGHEQLGIVVLLALAAGWFTDYIGIYSVFGGFVAGLALPRDALLRRELRARMMDVVSVLLLPLFFAFSGLNTRLGGLSTVSLLVPLLAIVAAGFVGKYVGCGLSMRALGFPWRQCWAVGALMNARGLMILIFINAGLAYGMISQEVFSMLVLVAVITTATAVPLYRLALPSRRETEPGTGSSHAPPAADIARPTTRPRNRNKPEQSG